MHRVEGRGSQAPHPHGDGGAHLARPLGRPRLVSGTMTAEEEPGVLKALAHAAPFLRSYLAPRLGLRIVPTLSFHIDKSIETGTRIEQLLRDLKHPEGG